MARTLTAVIIGSGNVATQLGLNLSKAAKIIQVYSPTIKHAERLANQLQCTAVSQPVQVATDADIYLVAVKDDAIIDVVRTFAGWGGLWLHTSGSTDIDIFSKTHSNYGVLYPLQTLKHDKTIDIKQIPLFIETNNEADFNELYHVAQNMGATDIIKCNSAQRMKLHVAAVFACNFVNYMLMQSQQLLRSCGTDINALEPLLLETMNKAIEGTDLEAAQTGPARRNDKQIIKKHIDALTGEQQQIYQFLTAAIIKHYTDHEQNSL